MKERLLSIPISDIFTRFLSLKYLPRWVILVFDLLISLVSFILTYKLVDLIELSNSISHTTPWGIKFIIVVTTQLFYYWVFRTFSGVLRYYGAIDTIRLLLSVIFNALTLALINLISLHYFGYAILDFFFIFTYSVLIFTLLISLRISVKFTYGFFNLYAFQTIPVVIYGTDSDAISIAKALETPNNERLRLAGFIAFDKQNSPKRIMGVKVHSFSKKLIEKELSKNIQRVIIAPSVFEQIDPKVDLDIFINNGMMVMTAPPMEVWDNEPHFVHNIKSIQIEDLLDRTEIEISTDEINNKLEGKVILITGAAGSIGSEIVLQVVKFNPRAIILLDQSESPLFELTNYLKDNYGEMMIRFIEIIADVRNKDRMEQIISNLRPDIIFHTAAYKHVPLMESHPSEGIQVNVKGTKIVADLAVKYKVSRFVMVSTDKAVNPTNVMGASKRIAEIYVQSLNSKIHKNEDSNSYKTKFITTRFGNVLGSNGSVIPIFKKQIEKGGPITVTHPDIIRYFMTIPEASLLVLEAGTMGKGGEIYIFDMGKPVRIYDMAKKMIRLAGFKPEVDIQIEFTGLRPGEKLYEELLNDKEITLKTDNKKIMIATVREYEYDKISLEIDKLIDLSYTNKDFLIVSQMKKIVPEYKSKNSQFEKLD